MHWVLTWIPGMLKRRSSNNNIKIYYLFLALKKKYSILFIL